MCYNHKLPLVLIPITKTLKVNGERFLEEILGPLLSEEIAQMVMEGKYPLLVEEEAKYTSSAQSSRPKILSGTNTYSTIMVWTV